MEVLYIGAIAAFAIAARWLWFQNQNALRELGGWSLVFALIAFIGLLFESTWPWWASLIGGGGTFLVCFCAQDIFRALLERRENRLAVAIPPGPVQHDFTVSGYQSRGREDDFNIV